MINLGTLKEITDLRSIWTHEALNFTPWVAENVELLADAVGLDITVDETESSVGDFNVDIYASETGTDRKIIIENQLEDTDHDHLGKLITYASGKGADVVIWVVKHAREEHKAAVEWLNNHTDDKIGFFLCEIKLFQIGDSDIAPSFTVVERPNDWTKEIKKTTNDEKVFWVTYIIIQMLRTPQILEIVESLSIETWGDNVSSKQAKNIARKFCLPFFKEIDESSNEAFIINALFEPMKNMS